MKQSTVETLYPDGGNMSGFGENVSLCLSSSSNQHPSVCHSTFDSLRLGRSSQSIASSFLYLWDSLNFKKDREFVGITFLFLNKNLNSVIHGFTPVERANHYMPSLKAGSIVKVDRFEVARCSSMYKITDHPFFICFISLTIIDEVITGAPETNLQSIRLFDNLQVIASTNLELLDVVGQICYVQGFDFTKETIRVVIRLLIDLWQLRLALRLGLASYCGEPSHCMCKNPITRVVKEQSSAGGS
ncbi:hypothetical protein YC2023_050499 [Brassica napus]